MSEQSADDVTTIAATGPAGPPRRRSLLAMRGDLIDAFPLPLEGAVTVGRGSGCEVRIDAPSLSRQHLRLEIVAGQLRVTDLDSANGTRVGGAPLVAQRAALISANDVIMAGDVELVVQEIRASDGAPRASAPRASGPVAHDGAAVVIDPVMRRLYDLAARLARGQIGVLITGETGVGKEVLAEFVHKASPRAAGPLVRVNCAALADALVEAELFGHERGAFTGAQRERRGLLETADGGTVLLDEIGEISPAVQAKLLRVIEDRQVTRVGASVPRPIDVRFLAATNRDLEADVASGRFRRDLYFRLAGAVLAIPPLRARPQEIEVLARTFAATAAARLGRAAPRLAEETIAALRARAWPGNARELRNVIERAVLLVDGPTIEADVLTLAAGGDAAVAEMPVSVSAAVDVGATAGEDLRDELARVERDRILAALDRHGGNQSRAAVELGMPRRTLVKRLEAYGVPRPRKR
ncbi:MAG: sigma 54-interacting transcriptional regulator [Deltaproteobacteria bacterium]|nr:sigma 54-interacting transcriptional regulator [Deltaproteobacteria bacterium]